jgi:hypothetical protein
VLELANNAVKINPVIKAAFKKLICVFMFFIINMSQM